MHLCMSRSQAATFSLMVACIVLLPLVLYPVFLMKVMCYALFACAFNLVLGYAASCRSAMPPSSVPAPISAPGRQRR